MIASRRIFIVSSSHPYHNCKIPFLYEHVMTPFMTPPAPTLLIPIIHLITRIYLAYRLCTNHVCPPFAFRITVSIKVVPCLCHHRSSTITFTGEPFDKPKVLYHQVTFRHLHSGSFSIAPCISCTIRIVVFVLFVPIPPTLPRIFILFRHLALFLIFNSTLGCLGRFLW
jgi:hypothetical protein